MADRMPLGSRTHDGILHNGVTIDRAFENGLYVHSAQFNVDGEQRLNGAANRLLGPTLRTLRQRSGCAIDFDSRDSESFRQDVRNFPPIVTVSCKTHRLDEGWTRITAAIDAVQDIWHGRLQPGEAINLLIETLGYLQITPGPGSSGVPAVAPPRMPRANELQDTRQTNEWARGTGLRRRE